MVGDVEHRGDARHLVADHRLDTLLEGHVGHAAALATALEAEVDGVVLDLDQGDEAAVGGDPRVDALVEQPLDRRGLGVVFSEI